MRRPPEVFRISALLLALGFTVASCGNGKPGGLSGSGGFDGAAGSGGAGTGGSGGAGTGGSGGAGSGGSGTGGSGDAAPDATQACSDKNPTCPPGQVCDLNQPARCGASTVGGTCITKPTACPQVRAAVCGCDGKTYGNDCERQSAGAELDHDGACTTSGCGPGMTFVRPCCGGAPPRPDAAPCSPPPSFCIPTSSCTTQGTMTCCFGDAGAGCCGYNDKGTVACLCA